MTTHNTDVQQPPAREASRGRRRPRRRGVFVISVAAELAGMHPQTLRSYEREGLIAPERTAGGTRLYSEEDLELLRRIGELADRGVNLAGIRRILELEDENARLRAQLEARSTDQAAAHPQPHPQTANQTA